MPRRHHNRTQQIKTNISKLSSDKKQLKKDLATAQYQESCCISKALTRTIPAYCAVSSVVTTSYMTAIWAALSGFIPDTAGLWEGFASIEMMNAVVSLADAYNKGKITDTHIIGIISNAAGSAGALLKALSDLDPRGLFVAAFVLNIAKCAHQLTTAYKNDDHLAFAKILITDCLIGGIAQCALGVFTGLNLIGWPNTTTVPWGLVGAAIAAVTNSAANFAYEIGYKGLRKLGFFGSSQPTADTENVAINDNDDVKVQLLT